MITLATHPALSSSECIAAVVIELPSTHSNVTSKFVTAHDTFCLGAVNSEPIKVETVDDIVVAEVTFADADDCMFWDIDIGHWSSEGLVSADATENNGVTCRWSHLTEFAAVKVCGRSRLFEAIIKLFNNPLA